MRRNIKGVVVFVVVGVFMVLIMPQIFMNNDIDQQPISNGNIEHLSQSGINQIREEVSVPTQIESSVNQNIINTTTIPSQETIPVDVKIEDAAEQLNYDILYKQHELLLGNLEMFIGTYNQLSVFYNDLLRYYHNIIPNDQKQYHITPLFDTNDVIVIEYDLVSLYFIKDIETHNSLKLKHDELRKYNAGILLFYKDVLEHTDQLYVDYNIQDRTPGNLGTYLGGGMLDTLPIHSNVGNDLFVNIEGSVGVDSNIHPDAKAGIITNIIDGDTLYFNGNKYRISLVDIYETDEVGGADATITLQQLCPIGSLAYMEDDSIQPSDKYGRFLGVVWCMGNDYNIDVGEYLYNHGYLKRFYTTYCDETEAATYEWANESNNWFYYNACEGIITG